MMFGACLAGINGRALVVIRRCHGISTIKLEGCQKYQATHIVIRVVLLVIKSKLNRINGMGANVKIVPANAIQATIGAVVNARPVAKFVMKTMNGTLANAENATLFRTKITFGTSVEYAQCVVTRQNI